MHARDEEMVVFRIIVALPHYALYFVLFGRRLPHARDEMEVSHIIVAALNVG